MRSQHRSVSKTNSIEIRRAVFTILAGIGFSAPAFATTYNFIPGIGTGTATPAGTANWTDPNSWAGTVSAVTTYAVPGASDQASSSTGATTIIDSAVPTVNEVRFANIAPGSNDYTVTGGGTAYPSTGLSTLTIASTGALNIASTNGTANGSLTIGNAIGANGTFNMNGGTLTTGGVAMTTESLGGLESLIIGGSASSATTAGPVGNFFMNSGTVTVANNFINGYGATIGSPFVGYASGNTTQSGGTINVAGAVIIGARGHGTYTMTGGSLIQTGVNGDSNSLGRDAFVLGQSDISGTSGNLQGGQGTFSQSGSSTVSISNGLYIANQSNTKGSYTISGGSLTVAGDISVASAMGSGVGIAAPVAATNNTGLFQVNGNSASTITANHMTANTPTSTLGFGIASSAGSSLISLSAANGFDGSAQLSSSTLVDIDPLAGFAPSHGSVFTLITATSISALPTLTLDGDAFDNSSLSIINNPNGTQSLIDTINPLPGDANGDGRINADDYALTDRGFAKHLTGFSNGDFNNDGVVNAADYMILDTAYLQQNPSAAPSLLSARDAQFGPAYVSTLLTSLPEPSLLTACGLAFLPRRRRTSHC
ncbi:MAG TPA: dockerin type I domain-containing protein [Tepidisphaeraceae bacterium]|jgi:hypothetical protein|nr:dockerin type I domain-containing protein [Tepidisphaeraceae bacterium]